MAETRVALVSGANKGIGFEIVRQLSRLGVIAVLGARDVERGRAAAEKLASEGLEPPVVSLDVDDPASITAAVAEVVRLFKQVDILVNNAGVFLDKNEEGQSAIGTLSEDILTRTFRTNVLGPLRLMQAVLPLMTARDYGRIVNLSSGMGQLSEMGAGYPAYRMSKTALNALTRTAAAEFPNANIKINTMCPGWVKTDMGGPNAERTPEQGAETAVWLATLPDDGPTGGFFRDKKPLPW
jgi:NAD(P)-dependent dehydrogenase (short-subunit alcohol dehydrogenase family)